MSEERIGEEAREGQEVDRVPLDAGDVVRRLCHLSAEVYAGMSVDRHADCFCGEGGFWSNAPQHYGPTYEQVYRNDGEVLEFIENAVRNALASKKTRES